MKPTTTLAIATVFLLLPFSIRAQTRSADPPTNGQQEAMHLVPAEGALVRISTPKQTSQDKR